MRKKPDETCDVIVLGGGDSGLLCAAYLAKSGAKTKLFSKQKQWDVTGNLLTEEFQGPYHFDMLPPYMIMMTDGAPAIQIIIARLARECPSGFFYDQNFIIRMIKHWCSTMIRRNRQRR